MLLSGRVRKPEEAETIQNILEKHFKRKVNPEALFSHGPVITQFSECTAAHCPMAAKIQRCIMNNAACGVCVSVCVKFL